MKTLYFLIIICYKNGDSFVKLAVEEMLGTERISIEKIS
jgi:hypothetical protein